MEDLFNPVISDARQLNTLFTPFANKERPGYLTTNELSEVEIEQRIAGLHR